MKDVAVVIVNYNTKDLLVNCLNSLFLQTKGVDFEVWVVDNDSRDGSVEMLKTEFPSVRLVENQENKGFGAANNIAIRQIEAKYIFLLNSDTIVLNNAIKFFYDFMEKQADAAVSGGYLLDNDRNQNHSYGFFTSVWEDIFIACDLKRLFKNFYLKKFQEQQTEQVRKLEGAYITGADMFIRKSYLDKSGYFDEDFFLYFEEVELTHRIKKNGGGIYLLPEPQIVHLDGGSCTENRRRIHFFEKSRKLYYQKVHNLFYYQIFVFFFRSYLLFRFLFTRNKFHLSHFKILNP